MIVDSDGKLDIIKTDAWMRHSITEDIVEKRTQIYFKDWFWMDLFYVELSKAEEPVERIQLSQNTQSSIPRI